MSVLKVLEECPERAQHNHLQTLLFEVGHEDIRCNLLGEICTLPYFTKWLRKHAQDVLSNLEEFRHFDMMKIILKSVENPCDYLKGN